MNSNSEMLATAYAQMEALDQSLDLLHAALSAQDIDAVMQSSATVHQANDRFAAAHIALLKHLGCEQAYFSQALDESVDAPSAANYMRLAESLNLRQQALSGALKNVTSMNFKLLSTLRGNGGLSHQASYGADGKDQQAQQALGFSTSA